MKQRIARWLGVRWDNDWSHGGPTRWDDFRCGLDSGYPLCCTIRFALARRRHDQAVQRGGTDALGGYVTCNIFHRGEPWSSRARILELLETPDTPPPSYINDAVYDGPVTLPPIPEEWR